MRIYKNQEQLISELYREVYEMGLVNDNNKYLTHHTSLLSNYNDINIEAVTDYEIPDLDMSHSDLAIARKYDVHYHSGRHKSTTLMLANRNGKLDMIFNVEYSNVLKVKDEIDLAIKIYIDLLDAFGLKKGNLMHHTDVLYCELDQLTEVKSGTSNK